MGKEIIGELDSYTELSPSESGLHIIVKGKLPPGPRQKGFGGEHCGVGLYDAQGGRYLTMTGARVHGNGIVAERSAELQRIHARLFPPKLAKAKTKAETGAALADDDLIERAGKARDGGKFARLWDGQWKGDYASPSEADLALCMKLAFWTGRDAGRIDALFRRSGLMRDKWDRDDYREATIGKAIEKTTEAWTPKPTRARGAAINLDQLKPDLALLNALTVFQGRVQFTWRWRRAAMIIAVTTEGREIIWPSTAELASFARSQAIIADASSVFLPTPPQGEIRSQWEAAAHLLLTLAEKDSGSALLTF